MAYTYEQLKMARGAKSVAELKALAVENGVNMSLEELEAKYKSMHTEGEISDDELDNVAGGGCGGTSEPKAVQGKAAPCGDYHERGGGGDEARHIFYSGKRCEHCAYFSTASDSRQIDPNYSGTGYCFYGVGW